MTMTPHEKYRKQKNIKALRDGLYGKVEMEITVKRNPTFVLSREDENWTVCVMATPKGVYLVDMSEEIKPLDKKPKPKRATGEVLEQISLKQEESCSVAVPEQFPESTQMLSEIPAGIL